MRSHKYAMYQTLYVYWQIPICNYRNWVWRQIDPLEFNKKKLRQFDWSHKIKCAFYQIAQFIVAHYALHTLQTKLTRIYRFAATTFRYVCLSINEWERNCWFCQRERIIIRAFTPHNSNIILNIERSDGVNDFALCLAHKVPKKRWKRFHWTAHIVYFQCITVLFGWMSWMNVMDRI